MHSYPSGRQGNIDSISHLGSMYLLSLFQAMIDVCADQGLLATSLSIMNLTQVRRNICYPAQAIGWIQREFCVDGGAGPMVGGFDPSASSAIQ
jgi:hypothetical protein